MNPEFQRQLTVIVPAFNEVRTIARVLERLVEAPSVVEIIVADDGSTDETPLVLNEYARFPYVEVLHHDRNRGKGAAIRTGIKHAIGRFVIIQDADLEYDPADYQKLMDPLLSGEADVVYGSRYLNNANHFTGRRWFDWGVKLLNLAVRLIYGVKITDEATCYKVFPASLLRAMDLRCERFEFCPEVTAKACRLGLRIMEVPIRYSPRSIAEGKKIRLRDGMQALWTLWKYRNWEGTWNRSIDEELPAMETRPVTNAVHQL